MDGISCWCVGEFVTLVGGGRVVIAVVVAENRFCVGVLLLFLVFVVGVW